MVLTAKLHRRAFLQTAAALGASAMIYSQESRQRLFDLHQHSPYSGRNHEQFLAHQEQLQVDTTVLLAGDGWMLSVLGGNLECTQLQADHRDRLVRFTSVDPRAPNAVEILRNNIERGAIGIGEMKYQVQVDSPEMHRVYKLAEEMQVPVLIHFEHEMYNLGIERFHNVLKAYPKVNFIGHAQTWWGNISADLDPQVMYPAGPVKAGGLTDRLLSDYPNLYGDLSAGSGLNSLTRDPEFSRGFLERHSRKLIWGSDCDCRDGQGGGVSRGYCIGQRSLETLGELLRDPAARRPILYDNGMRVVSGVK